MSNQSRRLRAEWIIYADGSLQPHPTELAQSGAGIVVTDARGLVVYLANQRLNVFTNNEAEYGALILALETALRAGVGHVEVRMDSEVVVGQMEGQAKVNSPRLKPLHLRACDLVRQLTRVRCIYIPRERNAVADALATEAAWGRRWLSEPIGAADS